MIISTASLPKIGDRITGNSAPPDDGAIREWLGSDAYDRWTHLRTWIDASYPEVFAPDWLYGGKNRGGPCASRRPGL